MGHAEWHEVIVNQFILVQPVFGQEPDLTILD